MTLNYRIMMENSNYETRELGSTGPTFDREYWNELTRTIDSRTYEARRERYGTTVVNGIVVTDMPQYQASD